MSAIVDPVVNFPDDHYTVRDGDCDPCRPSCPSVFDRVVVSYLTVGFTRVMWELLPTFTDPSPLTFQLQVGTTANNDATDWEDVGLPVTDQYSAYDDEQRVWGNVRWTHYRVKVTSPRRMSLSDPVDGMGTLDRRHWRIALELVRARLAAYRYGPGGQEGYLFKRRVTGQPCSKCRDYQTEEVRRPDCPSCYGTGFECGYYFPTSCVWAELSPRKTRVHLDGGQARGTINDVVVTADMVMTELLGENDVWVAARTDDRYFVHTVANTVEVRGHPVTARVELRPVPFSSSIYSIVVPDQLRAVGLT